MKLKKYLVSLMVAVTFGITFAEFNVQAEVIESSPVVKEFSNQSTQVQYYDANDNLIKPYENGMQYAYSRYPFYKTVFSSNIWIGGGAYFYNPHYIEFERTNRPKKLAIYFYDSRGAYEGKAVTAEGTGWIEVPLEHLPRGTSHKFKFVSENGQRVEIKHGYLYHS
ncbi:hypothetical protein [Bacillus thuringiensis]|uniref:Uncharacterized protein n=1 Tax=Bacillus thuringiensis subsp. jegathesan TaxID=56955 RepID=A0A9X6M600_BACTJ|nr:hypothetical protein [Bacillus thuringiensis]OUB63552.1 hypothetical protein BK750_20210 [Bacillus thuringiensis serovar jegathesan]